MQRQKVDGEMGEVAADAACAPCRPSQAVRVGAGVLVAEGDAVVDVVADRLDPRPARRRIAEQRPGGVREPVGVAVAAAQQEDEHVVGQVLDRVLLGVRHDGIGLAASRCTMKSVEIVSRPAGATMRVQMLPKPSR